MADLIDGQRVIVCNEKAFEPGWLEGEVKVFDIECHQVLLDTGELVIAPNAVLWPCGEFWTEEMVGQA